MAINCSRDSDPADEGELTGIDHPSPLGYASFTYDSLSRVVTHTDGKV